MPRNERFGPEGISRWDRDTESWVTLDPFPRHPETRCAPAGLCIYCGATNYTDQGGKLHNEHIVPLSINGNYVFPEASCYECGQKTGRNEAAIMRGGFRAVLEYLQLRSRTKDRPSELPLFNVNRINGNKVMIPIEDYPVMWMIPRFDLPKILRTPGYVSSGNPTPWSTAINFDHDKLAKHGITNFTTNQIDIFAYVRMIAKIGHSLAVSRYGLNYFVPYLRHIIMNEVGPEAFEYIGGLPERPHYGKELHGLKLRTIRVGTRILIVAEIRLFATLEAPIHLAVVGELRD
jgi:HNH endonuclease